MRAGLVKETFKNSDIWTGLGRMGRTELNREGWAFRQPGLCVRSVQRRAMLWAGRRARWEDFRSAFGSESGSSSCFGCITLVLASVSVLCLENRILVEAATCRSRPCFQPSLIPFFQILLSKQERLFPFWDRVQELLSAEAKPKKCVFARTY